MSQGQNTTPIAAATSANTQVRKAPGMLRRIIITAVGTAAVMVYDNGANTVSGTIIGALPASAAIGPYEFECPCNSGIVVAGNAALPAMTVIWD